MNGKTTFLSLLMFDAIAADAVDASERIKERELE